MKEISNKSNKGCVLIKVKSKYIIKQIFDNLQQKNALEILRYNKKLRNVLNKKINEYKNEYLKIEIEIFPLEKIDKNQKFINILEKNESLFHIYFNDNNIKEIRRNEINKDDKIEKIKIIIDSKIKSLRLLFYECKCIKKININKFNRTDIKDMSEMFGECRNLEEINFISFKTDNVEKMNNMFTSCKCLKKLNLSKFNTKKVIYMN